MGLLLQKIYKLSHSFILSRSRCRRTHTEIGQEHVCHDVTGMWPIDKIKLNRHHIIKRELKQINFTEATLYNFLKTETF